MNTRYEIDEIVNKFLLPGDKFMLEMPLRQPGLRKMFVDYLKKKERTQKFKETVYSRYIYQNDLDKACFQQNMTYGDLTRFN